MTGIGIKRKLENKGFAVLRYGVELNKRQLNDIPKEPGIYALFHGNTLQYIGPLYLFLVSPRICQSLVF
jgi:hypothetical protein